MMRNWRGALFGLAGLQMVIGCQAFAAGDRELGQYLSSECVTCHQATGKVADGLPPIVGWPEDQFVAVMNSYKDKQRDNAVMQTIAGRLKDEDIAALAAFFSAKK